MKLAEFKAEDCEVSDDKVIWNPAIDNAGRYCRVKPDVWAAFSKEMMAELGATTAYGGFSIVYRIEPVNKQTK